MSAIPTQKEICGVYRYLATLKTTCQLQVRCGLDGVKCIERLGLKSRAKQMKRIKRRRSRAKTI